MTYFALYLWKDLWESFLPLFLPRRPLVLLYCLWILWLGILFALCQRDKRFFSFVLLTMVGSFFFFLRFYLFIFREQGREEEREREMSMCGCLSRGPHWGPGLQPRHVPWLGVQPVTLVHSLLSTHCVTPARAPWWVFIHALGMIEFAANPPDA